MRPQKNLRDRLAGSFVLVKSTYSTTANRVRESMKKEFLRTMVLVLAAFAAVSVFVCSDAFREFEDGYIQGAMLKAPSEGVPDRPDLQVVYPSQVATSGQSQNSAGSAAFTKLFALTCLSACVLRC